MNQTQNQLTPESSSFRSVVTTFNSYLVSLLFVLMWTAIALELIMQQLIIYFANAPEKLGNRWMNFVIHPSFALFGTLLKSTTTVILSYVLFQVLFAFTLYTVLSVYEYYIRKYVPTLRQHHSLFPPLDMRISFNNIISLRLVMVYDYDLISQQIVSTSSVVPLPKLINHVLPTLKRVEIYLFGKLSIWLVVNNGRRVEVPLENSGQEALFTTMVVEARERGMKSEDIYKKVRPSNSEDPQGWFYKTKARICEVFVNIAHGADIATFKAIQRRGGRWHLFDANTEIFVDIDEFEQLRQFILETPNPDGSQTDSIIEAGHKLIKIRATGFLAHHLQAEAFHRWAAMKSEDFNDKFLKAMERIVDCIVEVAQRLQGEEQRNSYRQAVHFQLQFTIASASAVRHIVDNDVVPRGEIALQRCLCLCKLADDPQLAKEVFYHYKIHVENLCGKWEPKTETMKVFGGVIGKGQQ